MAYAYLKQKHRGNLAQKNFHDMTHTDLYNIIQNYKIGFLY